MLGKLSSWVCPYFNKVQLYNLFIEITNRLLKALSLSVMKAI